MPRSPFTALVLLSAFGAARAADEALIDSMDDLHFHAPKEKAQVELVDGKVGKAVRFSFEQGSPGAFCTSNLHGSAAWDRAAALSFWLKGDGSDHFGGLELIYDDDYAVRYDFAFPLKSTEWTEVVVPWRDLGPVLPGPKSNVLDPTGENKPSRISGVWFGATSREINYLAEFAANRRRTARSPGVILPAPVSSGRSSVGPVGAWRRSAAPSTRATVSSACGLWDATALRGSFPGAVPGSPRCFSPGPGSAAPE